jgi:hypothetical protein
VKALLMYFLCLEAAFANKYSEYLPDPRILDGASGADDEVLVFMGSFIFFGSFLVAHIFGRESYTPVKEVSIFIVIGVGIMILWARYN